MATRKAKAKTNPKTKPKTKPKAKAARKPASAAGEAKANEALVDRTIEILAAHDRVVSGSKREVGRFILEQYFEDDVALARSHDPHKAKSYRLLERRAPAETTWDARDLHEAVRIELAARSLPSELAGQLDASTLLALASVDDLARRAEIAARIVREQLHGKVARELIAAAATDERGGGRARTPAPQRGVAELERALERAREMHAFERHEVVALDPERRRAIEKRLDAVRSALEDAVRALRDYNANIQ